MKNANLKPKIITLSGEPGAGKTTVLKKLKELYEEKGVLVETHLVGQTFRQLADKLGVSVSELNKQAALRPEIDRMLDDELKNYSQKINSNPSPNTIYIIDSRMAWKFVNNSFSIRLTVPSTEAGKRIFSDSTRSQADQYSCIEDAVLATEIRKQNEIKRYKRLYGADLSDINNYQLVVNTEKARPEEIAKLISVCANLHRAGKFFPKIWQGNDVSVIPSKIQPKKISEEMQR